MPVQQLSAEFQKIAIEQLNEDPERIQDDINHLKDWLKLQPHLTSRQDDHFLLCFLRSSKFSLERTKEKLAAFYTTRTELTDYFLDRDPFSPEIQRILNSGAVLPLPKANGSTGPRIIMVRWCVCDPTTISFNIMIKIMYMIADILLQEDENTMIAGLHLIFDYRDFPPSYMLQFTPSVLHKSGVRLQSAYPIRLKGIDFINVPRFFDSLFVLIKMVLSQKVKDRANVYTESNVQNMYEYIPKEILPQECGGNGGSVDEIRDIWKKKIESYSTWFEEDLKFFCDETLRPLMNEDSSCAQGAFRKLNVD